MWRRYPSLEGLFLAIGLVAAYLLYRERADNLVLRADRPSRSYAYTARHCLPALDRRFILKEAQKP